MNIDRVSKKLRNDNQHFQWVYIKDDGEYNRYDSYPKEGYPVLVSDEKNYSVATFLRSGEYIWVEDDVVNEQWVDFTKFKITKWRYIFDS